MLPQLTAIAFSFTSLHIPYDEQNYVNPGIHLEAENYRAGYYRNSNRYNGSSDYTAYLGYTLPIGSYQIGGIPIKYGLLAALDRGYDTPVIGALEFRVGARVVVIAAPNIGSGKHGAVLGFAYRIPLGN